jgi:hypothetical protein
VLGESAPSAQRCSLRAQPRIFLSELRDLRTRMQMCHSSLSACMQ